MPVLYAKPSNRGYIARLVFFLQTIEESLLLLLHIGPLIDLMFFLCYEHMYVTVEGSNHSPAEI